MLNRPIIITAGSAYVDVDVLACSIAYQELLQAQGYQVTICHTGPLNGTIPPALAQQATPLIKTSPPPHLDQAWFVLVDVSDPNYFENFVDHNRIYKIFDHHFGFENFWHQHLGNQAIIRPIGACATLIWQEFIKHAPQTLSPFATELLATAILSNTLNLQATVTAEADRQALLQLENLGPLPTGWRKKYYDQTKEFLLNHPEKAMRSDTKKIQFHSKSINFCQLEAWDGQALITGLDFKKIGSNLFDRQSWIISLLDISRGKNWLLSNDEDIIHSLKLPLVLEQAFPWFISQKLWLRKEILKFWQDRKMIKLLT